MENHNGILKTVLPLGGYPLSPKGENEANQAGEKLQDTI